jgi:hypothetical protein
MVAAYGIGEQNHNKAAQAGTCDRHDHSDLNPTKQKKMPNIRMSGKKYPHSLVWMIQWTIEILCGAFFTFRSLPSSDLSSLIHIVYRSLAFEDGGLTAASA